MTTRVLNIVGTAYRGTLEEQDDTILWLTSMCSGAGLDAALLFEGSAVNYAVVGQDASGLRFGDVEVYGPELEDDVAALVAKGVPIHYVVEDARTLGIDGAPLVAGVKPIARADLPALFADFDQVWHW